jgi:DNA polymerase-1
MCLVHEYSVIDSFEDAIASIQILSQSEVDFSFDFEATSLSPSRGEILGIGFCWGECKALYIPWMTRDISLFVGELESKWNAVEQCRIIDELRSLFTNPKSIKVAHNLDFELEWLSAKWDIEPVNTWDTFWYRFLTNPETPPDYEKKLALGYIADLKYPDLKGLKDIWKGVPEDENGDKDLSKYRSTETIGVYCCKDTDATYREYSWGKQDIETQPFKGIWRTRLSPEIHFVSRMSHQYGLLVDLGYLRSTRTELETQRKELLYGIQSQVGSVRFNPASSVDLQRYFFGKLGLVDKSNGHLDDPVLTAICEKDGISIAGEILEYRKLVKLIRTYFDGIEAQIDKSTGRIHADFIPWGTGPGRLSCREPNLQNLPVRRGPIVKRMFVAPPRYKILAGDYSQMELRLIAWYSQDPVLLKAFLSGVDVHSLTASIVFGIPIEKIGKKSRERQIGKTCNFAWCYGGKPGTLLSGKSGVGNEILGVNYAKRMGISYEKMLTSKIPHEILIDKARELHGRYFAPKTGYREILTWGRSVISQARKDGYVTSSYGRRSYFPNLNSEDESKRDHAEKQAVNFNPQSTGHDWQFFHFMDIIAESDRRGLGMIPVLEVHDQMVTYTPEDRIEEASALMAEFGVRPDESGIEIPMLVEPVVGNHLGEV